MAQISIIIPVFNVKNYLSRCLDSVSKQTITDFECILVDDGSTDGSGAICNEYANIDNRFKVLHCENGGPAAARNKGLEIVISPWVTFIDADDYAATSYLENFLRYNLTEETTQVIQGYHCMGYNGEDIDTLYHGTTYVYHEEVKGERSRYIEENNLLYNWAVWCKVFSTKIIRKYHIQFDERMFCSEDGIFWHNYLCYVNKIVFIPERGYTYYCPKKFNSVSRGGKHIQSIDSWLAIADNYKHISSVLPERFCMSRKYASYIKMFYWHNYFRALLKPKQLASEQYVWLKKLKPSRLSFVPTFRGFIYWSLNLIPVQVVRFIREIF